MSKRNSRNSIPVAGDSLAAIDEDLAWSAMTKLRSGQRLTDPELRAYRAREKAREQESMERHYSAVPQKYWKQWSGRHGHSIACQAKRYGFPYAATINLEDFVKWFHDFLRDNAKRLAASESEEPSQQGPASPALERKREAEARMAELELAVRVGELVNVSELQDQRMYGINKLRKCGEKLERRYGPKAKKILDDTLLDLQRAYAIEPRKESQR